MESLIKVMATKLTTIVMPCYLWEPRNHYRWNYEYRNSNNEGNSPLTKSVELVPDTFDVKFIYQGQKYISSALGYENHIEIQYSDVKQVYDKLQSVETMSALFRHDGFIEYFDNISDLAKNFDNRVKSSVTPSPRWIGFQDQNNDRNDD